MKMNCLPSDCTGGTCSNSKSHAPVCAREVYGNELELPGSQSADTNTPTGLFDSTRVPERSLPTVVSPSMYVWPAFRLTEYGLPAVLPANTVLGVSVTVVEFSIGTTIKRCAFPPTFEESARYLVPRFASGMTTVASEMY